MSKSTQYALHEDRKRIQFPDGRTVWGDIMANTIADELNKLARERDALLAACEAAYSGLFEIREDGKAFERACEIKSQLAAAIKGAEA